MGKIGLFDELNELEALEPDWDEEGAPKINRNAIEWAYAFVRELLKRVQATRFDLRLPYVAPTPQGGVSLSWNLGNSTLWVLIYPDDDVFTYITSGHQSQPVRRRLSPGDTLASVLADLGAL